MFYVYAREYYPVYEPAEGGYYVSASKIVECCEFNYLNHALELMREWVEDAEREGETLNYCTYEYEFHTDESGDIVLLMPLARFNHSIYVGEGFDIGISVDKPADNPYQGYC